ncbi:uncharacterized protein NKAPD1-like isoform X2 [Uloborus diversus]|uniref:uncharacterized protein NKAPD1-like isoform X2 n=1 Tax=Uloborus diversus TaxID=327109 RepID=UPI0024095DF0|nr:uncharacterized protein NKAPD1-like isoform X2 [Uloborus diversus]
MVTEAGKELLRNTINTAKFHNRILEENEMWKQWELECGLTMMVSDDDILKKIKKQHQCSKHRKRDKSREHERCKRKTESKASTSRGDRWDHSGFHELYPDESPGERCNTSDSEAKNKKWDHSGFHELYPDESPGERCNTSDSEAKKKKWDHSGFHELYPDESQGEKSNTSESEAKIKKHKRRKQKHSSESSSDNEIWEDFKKFKKNEKERNKLKLKNRSNFDNHVKEWKKHSNETANKSSHR